MARSIIGSGWTPLQRNELNRMLTELYEGINTATGTKNKIDAFLDGTGVVSRKMLANNSVDTTKIDDGAVNNSKIADGSVTNGKIGSLAISTAKLDAHVVTGPKLAPNAVSETKMADNSVNTRVIAPEGVRRANIFKGAVGTDEIEDGKVTNSKLAELPFKRNIVASNTLLSTVAENGRYVGLAGNSYSDLPATMVGKSFVLDVQTFNDNHNFVIQTITETRTPSHSYIRYIQKGTFVGNWEKDLSLTPQIQRRVIPENATTRFMTSNGQFLGIAGYNYADIPAEVDNRSFMLDVKTYNDNELFVIQTLTVTSNIDVTYKRYIRDGGSQPFVSEWYKDYSLIKPKNEGTPSEGNFSHPLAGKTIVCFGDSLTEFGDYTGKISELTGANVINVGFGGCRMAKSPEGSNRFIYNEMSMVGVSETLNSGDFTALENAAENLKNNHGDDNTAAVSRFKNTDFNQVDYITIFYGTNDWNGEIPLGSIDSQDVFEFNGAINKSIENILTKYPHIRILLLTPTWRARKNVGDGLETDVNPNPNGVYMIEYVDAIEERAKSHKIPSFNMYTQSGINIYTSEYYQSDGLHLTDKGDELISRIISHELSGM